MRMSSAHPVAPAVVLLLGVTALSTPSRSELLYYEPFDYPAGPDLTDLAGGNPPWTSPGNPNDMTDDWNIEAGSLSYPNLATSGNRVNFDQIDGGSRQSVRRDLPATVSTAFSTEGTTIYLTCLVSDSAGFFFNDNPIFLNLSSDDSAGGSKPIRHFVQVEDSGGQSETQFAAVADDGTAHLIAYRVLNQAGNDDIRALIDPDLLQDEPDWSSATLISNRDITGSINEHRLIMGNVETARRGDVDEFRIATTWAEAAPIATVDYTETNVVAAATLTFDSIDGRAYQLETSGDLVSGLWEGSGFRITGNGGKLTAHDPTDTNKGYRLVIP